MPGPQHLRASDPADRPAADPILFDEGSATIRPDTAATLDGYAAFINDRARAVMDVTIAGHAATYEKRPPALAAARAEAVRRYLVNRGVRAGLIRVTPFGAGTSPCASPDSGCDPRRVDFQISGSGYERRVRLRRAALGPFRVGCKVPPCGRSGVEASRVVSCCSRPCSVAVRRVARPMDRPGSPPPYRRARPRPARWSRAACSAGATTTSAIWTTAVGTCSWSRFRSPVRHGSHRRRGRRSACLRRRRRRGRMLGHQSQRPARRRLDDGQSHPRARIGPVVRRLGPIGQQLLHLRDRERRSRLLG